MISNLFQIFDITPFTPFAETAINLLNHSFIFAGRVYGYALEIALNSRNQEEINEFLKGLTSSFYVIAAVFMLFRISISVFNYILDPDKMSDSKTGPGKLLTNIVVTLIMLVSFYPNGIVYNTLDEIETAVLNEDSQNNSNSGFMTRIFENTGDNVKEEKDKHYCEKVKKGTKEESYDFYDEDGKKVTEEEYTNSCEKTIRGLRWNELIFANGVASPFYKCNLEDNKTKNEVRADYQNNINAYMEESTKESNGIFSKIINNPILKYTVVGSIKRSLPAKLIKNLIKVKKVATDEVDPKICYQFEVSPLTIEKAGEQGQVLAINDHLDFYFFTGIIFSIALIIYLFVLCVEVIIRNFKLILYQIIAPIPIINGIDPNDKMRTRWLKGYFGAYLDLFMKIFAINILAHLIVAIPVIQNKMGPIQSLFFLVAILVFVKMVPNIISKVLGIENLGGSFKDVTGMLKKGLGAGMGAGMVVGAGIGGVVGALTAKGGFGTKAWGAIRGAFQGGKSGRKGDIFKGSQNISKINAEENDMRDEGVELLDRMIGSAAGKVGIPSSYSKKKEDLDKEEIDLQKEEAGLKGREANLQRRQMEIDKEKADLRDMNYVKAQTSVVANLTDESKKSGADDIEKNKPQHRDLLEVQAYNELKRRLDAKVARGEELTEYEQSAFSEAKKKAGDAIAEFDAKSSFIEEGRGFKRTGEKIKWNDDGTYEWEKEDQEVVAKRDVGAYNRMMAINAALNELDMEEFTEDNINSLDLGTLKDDMKMKEAELGRKLEAANRGITIKEENLSDERAELGKEQHELGNKQREHADKLRDLENSRDKLIHDAYHNNGS